MKANGRPRSFGPARFPLTVTPNSNDVLNKNTRPAAQAHNARSYIASDPIRVVLPFEDQASADVISAQVKDLSEKIYSIVQPVFVSQKIGRYLKFARS